MFLFIENYFYNKHTLKLNQTEAKGKFTKQYRSKKVVDFQNLMKVEFCWKVIFEILIIYKNSLGSCKVPHKISVRFGSAVLTFIGYKQTSKVYNINIYNRSSKFIKYYKPRHMSFLFLRKKNDIFLYQSFSFITEKRDGNFRLKY